jgi:hypothetical protein
MEDIKQLKAIKIENQLLKEQAQKEKIFYVKIYPKLPVFKADDKDLLMIS